VDDLYLLTKRLNQLVKPSPDLSAEARILDAARTVFFRKGFAGARMQDIADEAGINKALLHYYYRNKETLFGRVLHEAFDKLLPRVHEIFDGGGGLPEKLRAFVKVYVSMALENPQLPLFVLGALQSGENEGIREQFQDISERIPFIKFRQEIAKAVEEGSIRPVEPLQLVLHTLSLCLFPFVARPAFEMVNHLPAEAYQQLLERRREEVADFILASLRPDTPHTEKSTDHA
jgi:TetR/AcrR family transcriptional regulator